MEKSVLSIECNYTLLRYSWLGRITWYHVLPSSDFDRCWVSLPSSSFSCSAQNVNLLVTTPLAMLMTSGWPGGCASSKKSVDLFRGAFWLPSQAIWKEWNLWHFCEIFSQFTKGLSASQLISSCTLFGTDIRKTYNRTPRMINHIPGHAFAKPINCYGVNDVNVCPYLWKLMLPMLNEWVQAFFQETHSFW